MSLLLALSVIYFLFGWTGVGVVVLCTIGLCVYGYIIERRSVPPADQDEEMKRLGIGPYYQETSPPDLTIQLARLRDRLYHVERLEGKHGPEEQRRAQRKFAYTSKGETK